jgi:hypothetical protein
MSKTNRTGVLFTVVAEGGSLMLRTQGAQSDPGFSAGEMNVNVSLAAADGAVNVTLEELSRAVDQMRSYYRRNDW